MRRTDMSHRTASERGVRRRRLAALGLGLLAGFGPAARAQEAWVLVGHPGVPPLDQATVQRLYTGRAIEVAGTQVTVVNAPEGAALRARFLAEALKTDGPRYIAYWTVRRHVGKGVPPRELPTDAAVIQFVRSTAGGIGYVAVTSVTPDLNIVYRP